MPHFTAADGASLYYEDAGEGLPLLCLSGLTRNGRDFDFVAPHLAGVRLIRMDYRGRARSDWTGAATYTLPQEAKDALALLDHLGLDKAAILGTSRGGLIAMLLAVMAPDRLLGAALNDVGPVIETQGIGAIAGYLGRNPGFATLDEAAAVRVGDPAFPDVPAARWRQMISNNTRETMEGLVIDYDPALREAVLENAPEVAPDLWPLFEALATKPLALIWGLNSDLLSKETVAGMQARAPGLHLAEVPNRGHTPFLDEPEALSVLGTWLEDLT
ncbi:Pimeloyl-ACP methyl ester carboxylesterase [Pseudooceanicola antarcticus]|uniref:Alpha/beta hydrolase n=1 Tax=Pseudooceanicola antarcticus TaxID=1247613 RepID=A0A285II42_9RHOB|nr:alpha/beta hydrolase [Pseudooceanicola antarcticus]PJE29123.1 alpha/beta hydrolase [Pseudooceanicola antarcticus]SNY46611.1 Pimeloyl-ACP methyl ester carboxylesterase [Pseudooceanicola antarcticus]